MQLGIERLVADKTLRRSLYGVKVALTGHPASVTSQMIHSLDALAACGDLKISAAFGPQHGMRGDKQDNMIESDNFVDQKHHIPVFSLYGQVRRPTDDMLSTFDVLLFDVQDLGCRIYTYITTLLYLLEACAAKGKRFWVLDRPNPAGRPIEGNLLADGWQSFVGAGCIAMRHGL
ncbi:MAG TPA: exo-beta-N-acetylmuramidase NamZ domain-containing protein, partial [Gammaproteobacteria bacterium]